LKTSLFIAAAGSVGSAGSVGGDGQVVMTSAFNFQLFQLDLFRAGEVSI
jgi:hypothetical protein